MSSPQTAATFRPHQAEAALADGDLITARHLADDAVTTTAGWHHVVALTTRARVAIEQGEPQDAEHDAHDALACAASSASYLAVPDVLECLADLASDSDHHQGARLFGAAEALRQRIGVVRFKIYDARYENSLATLRNAMDNKDFDSAWGEGAALPIEETIAYARVVTSWR